MYSTSLIYLHSVKLMDVILNVVSVNINVYQFQLRCDPVSTIAKLNIQLLYISKAILVCRLFYVMSFFM